MHTRYTCSMEPREILARHLGQAAPDPDPDTSFYSDDIVAEFPYAPDDHTRRLEGAEAVVAFMRRMPSFAEGFSLGEPTIHPIDGGFVAEYHGEATFKSTGKRYKQDYVSLFTVREGKIAGIREYYNPLRVLQAMGEVD